MGTDGKFNFGQVESEKREGQTSRDAQESRWSLQLQGEAGLSRLLLSGTSGLTGWVSSPVYKSVSPC